MARRTLVLDQPVVDVEVTKKKSRKGIYIGIAILAMVPVVGSTFAANIGINSGNAIEFGQGTNTVTACDATITITPTAGYASSAFHLATVALSGVDTTACNAKTFKLVARDTNGAALTDGTITFKLDSSVTTSGAAGIAASPAISGATGNVASGTVTLTPTGTISASSIAAFTLETS